MQEGRQGMQIQAVTGGKKKLPDTQCRMVQHVEILKRSIKKNLEWSKIEYRNSEMVLKKKFKNGPVFKTSEIVQIKKYSEMVQNTITLESSGI